MKGKGSAAVAICCFTITCHSVPSLHNSEPAEPILMKLGGGGGGGGEGNFKSGGNPGGEIRNLNKWLGTDPQAECWWFDSSFLSPSFCCCFSFFLLKKYGRG